MKDNEKRKGQNVETSVECSVSEVSKSILLHNNCTCLENVDVTIVIGSGLNQRDKNVPNLFNNIFTVESAQLKIPSWRVFFEVALQAIDITA